VLFSGDCLSEQLVRFPVSGIDTVVTDHLEMFFGDMLSQACDEIKDGDSLNNEFVILVAVVMEGDKIPVIGINPRSSNDWSAEIAANVFDDLGGLAVIRHGADIEAIFVVSIDGGLDFFEGVADSGMKFI